MDPAERPAIVARQDSSGSRGGCFEIPVQRQGGLHDETYLRLLDADEEGVSKDEMARLDPRSAFIFHFAFFTFKFPPRTPLLSNPFTISRFPAPLDSALLFPGLKNHS